MISAPSYTIRIWIAGDYADAIRAVREFAEEGLCAAVTPAAYVYTGGMEDGVCVTIINYSRFPKTPDEIRATAGRLADYLRERLYQDSYSIEGPDVTEWFSRRAGKGE